MSNLLAGGLSAVITLIGMPSFIHYFRARNEGQMIRKEIWDTHDGRTSFHRGHYRGCDHQRVGVPFIDHQPSDAPLRSFRIRFDWLLG